MSWRTFGHTNPKQLLQMQLDNDRLAHAYLFTGPAGIGKRHLAREFAEKIINHSSSADITEHDLAVAGTAEAVRELLRMAALTPIVAARKVVILDHSHQASIAVSNMLLKTLEEPPAHTVFILLSDTARLLPTIMSRCQVVQLSRLTPAELAEYAAAHNITTGEVTLAAAGGSIDRLRLLTGVGDGAAEIVSGLTELRNGLSSGSASRLLLVQQLANLEDEVLTAILEAWLYEQLEAGRNQPQRFAAVRVILETLSRLRANANKKLALEYFLLHPAV